MNTNRKSITTNGQGIGAPSDARTNLPEYKQWQNAMRPEDTGHSDGAAGLPLASDSAAHFESKVLDQLNSRLGVVRNKFAQDDAIWLAEISALAPEASYLGKQLEEKRAARGRPVLIRLNRGSGIALVVAASLLSASLAAVLWLDRGLTMGTALLLAIFASAICSLASYTFGLVLWQGSALWQKALAALALLLLVCGIAAVFDNMNTPGFDRTERLTLALFMAFALLTAASAAFLMNDSDAAYQDIDGRYRRLHPRLEWLRVYRAENIIFNTNVARRHVDLARQMVSSYRQSNLRARKPGCAAPEFFASPPAFPIIGDDWLQIVEVTKP